MLHVWKKNWAPGRTAHAGLSKSNLLWQSQFFEVNCNSYYWFQNQNGCFATLYRVSGTHFRELRARSAREAILFPDLFVWRLRRFQWYRVSHSALVFSKRWNKIEIKFFLLKKWFYFEENLMTFWYLGLYLMKKCEIFSIFKGGTLWIRKIWKNIGNFSPNFFQ